MSGSSGMALSAVVMAASTTGRTRVTEASTMASKRPMLSK